MEIPLNDPQIPWRGISELVERAGELPDEGGFLSRILGGIESLIPHDVGGGLLGPDGRYFLSHGLGGTAAARYNEYYYATWGFVPQPLAEAIAGGSRHDLLPVTWSQYPNTEFVADFCRPNNIGSTLIYFLPKNSLSITLNRGFRTRKFSDTEKTTLRIINAHMNNYLTLYNKIEDQAICIPDLSDIRNRYPFLSNRETEVVRQTCMGFSAALIAKRSGVSRRTVESQLQSAYRKLNVDKKKELVEKITGSQDQ